MKKMMSLAVVCLALHVSDLSMKLETDEKSINTKFSGSVQLTFELKTIKLSTGVILEYAEQGDKNGTPVILLHGLSDSWKSFEAVLSHLPSSLHVFSVSQRGHGNSSKATGSYKPADFARDISAFIDQQKLSSAIIVGHSMGSFNAQCFAANYPHQTKGLVLLGAFADFNKPFIGELEAAIKELKDPVDSVFISDFQKSTIVRPIGDDMLRGFIDESHKLPSHVWKAVASGWTKEGYINKLKSFNKPSLIIWGDKDAYCTKEDQLLLNETLKKSKLIIYKGTGHAIHWEETDRFAKELTAFAMEIKP